MIMMMIIASMTCIYCNKTTPVCSENDENMSEKHSLNHSLWIR